MPAHTHWQFGAAHYAVGILDPFMLGRGIGRVVTKLICGNAFDVLGLREVSLTVLDFNERARRCYTSVGFVEIERVSSGVVDGHRRAEDLVMTLSRDGWVAEDK